jgi:hypothetical protein
VTREIDGTIVLLEITLIPVPFNPAVRSKDAVISDHHDWSGKIRAASLN